MTTPSSKKTAVIYARYSSDMQKASSIDGQLLLCRNVALRNNLDVVGEFVDAAKSGLTEGARDGYQRLLNGVRSRQFDVVVVEHFDRLSRDPATIQRLKQVFEFNGVELMDQKGVYATATDISIASLYNTIYKPQLAEKVRRGHDNAVANGRIPGSYAYGYRPRPGAPGERIIDENEAKIVLCIFKEYAAGRSTRTIAADLTREGVPSPGATRHKNKAGRTTWNHQCITGGRHGRGIIGNELYIGEIHWNVRSTILNPETQKKQKRRNPAERHIIVKKPELRIVPQGLWDLAQKVRRVRAVSMFGPTGQPRRRAVSPRNNEHPLAGVLRCGVCNGHMRIAQSSRNGAPRAACASAHQRGTCEHTRSFDMDVLLEDASEKIQVKLLSPKAIEEAMRTWKEERKNDRNNGSEHNKLERRRRALTIEIERLSYAIANSRRKPDELLKRIDECDLERESVEERLRLLGGGGENIVGFDRPKFSDRYSSEVRRLITALKTNPKAIETRIAFRNLIECIVVHPVRKRMPYEYTPYLNSSALYGKNLFPENRSKEREISTFAYYDNGKSGKSVSS
ncbi:recombinase family protein [Bradyrhizobium canariense]|uniref:recombinase family protein n=1 Tax=Bradyrhizobium canariense TaxID=255045 RepID=UPI000A1985EF|nr:recombinase family protein [Bradyrhizobium canariense]OSI22261.1 DNA invertase [Bradyrhizobium canariense]OSI26851.1 DNA invertase [Bradyrhizobium canariense]OSI39397.1 DNA invertase [Bradyrhizobium canariense]OSI45829.1 DNA invertase [Bradyrhizobium canariense]OSI52619.1 DNA invertase [Bradyrhizobium canariense]